MARERQVKKRRPTWRSGSADRFDAHGNLTIQGEEFTGIVLVLDGGDNTNRRCGAGDGKSKYKSESADIRGYVYAESTNKEDALYVDSDSTVGPLPTGQEYEELLDLTWSSGSIRLQSWRELYQ